MKVMNKWLGIAFLLFAFISCKDDGGGNQFYGMDLSSIKMDISDAKMLAICGPNEQTRSGIDEIGLFKIDDDGNMTAVQTTVEGTQEEVRLVPERMVPLSEDYVLMTHIMVYSENDPYGTYLGDYMDSYVVRKSDGAVFKIDGEKYPAFSDTYFYSNYEEYGVDMNPRTDKHNNAYCLVSSQTGNGGDIYKFSLGNLSDVTMQRITLDQFPVYVSNYPLHPYEVDDAGNCVTFVNSVDGNQKRVILYKALGGMYEFPEDLNIFEYFVGDNGNLYCCSQTGDWGNYEYRIYPLEIGNQVNYNFSNSISKRTQTAYADYDAKVVSLENGYIHVFLASASSAQEGANNMLVFNSRTNEIKEVGFLPGEMNKVIGISNNSIYRIMNHSIYKYDFLTDEKSVIPIQFDFNTCSIYRDWQAYNVPQGSKFILGAIRNTDMAILRIEVDMETGEATVFEDIQDRPIISLVQIG